MVIFAGIVTVRRQRHHLPVIDETEAFRTFTDTSPAAFELDPRIEEEESGASPEGDGDVSRSRPS